jgi:cysteine-rich repeat protein
LADPADVSGTTLLRPDEVKTSCGAAESPELVFEFVAKRTGQLDVRLSGDASARVAVQRAEDRTACDGAELACGRGFSSVPIAAGDRVWLVVESAGATGVPFSLAVRSRTPGCGDGVRDDGEQCDDGNTQPGDGCVACQVTSSEGADNDAVGGADEFPAKSDYFGLIDPKDDVDVVAVETTAPVSRLAVSTFDFGDGACEDGKLDSVLELLDGEGSVLASADDTSSNRCAKLVTGPLSPGLHFLRVSASAEAVANVFPYVLHVELSECGNGHVEEGEFCDDGAREPGDGCSATCLVE